MSNSGTEQFYDLCPTDKKIPRKQQPTWTAL